MTGWGQEAGFARETEADGGEDINGGGGRGREGEREREREPDGEERGQGE